MGNNLPSISALARPEWADSARIERIKASLSSKRLARVGAGIVNRYGSSGSHHTGPYCWPDQALTDGRD